MCKAARHFVAYVHCLQQRRSQESTSATSRSSGVRPANCFDSYFKQHYHRSQASHCKQCYAQNSFRTPLTQTTVHSFRISITKGTCAAQCTRAFSVLSGGHFAYFLTFLISSTTLYKLATVNKRENYLVSSRCNIVGLIVVQASGAWLFFTDIICCLYNSFLVRADVL